MIPLPENPTVAILLNENDEVVGVSTNVSADLKVDVTRSQRIYNEDLAPGKTFRKGTDGNDNP
jgi:hypothetical protein